MSTTPSYKRHSLNISTSTPPRPLQLIDRPPSASSLLGPMTAPGRAYSYPRPLTTTPTHPRHANSPTPGAFSTPRSPSPSPLPSPLRSAPVSSSTPRRQSSISYKRSSYDPVTNTPTLSEEDFTRHHQHNHYNQSYYNYAQSPASSAAAVMAAKKRRPVSMIYPSRPASVSANAKGGVMSKADRRKSLGLGLGPDLDLAGLGGEVEESERERQPLTLAEKHADLLRFIAQKESKCLELRSQLSVHEAELLQLKRKWERIVSRSFESPTSLCGSASSASSTSSPPSSFPTSALSGSGSSPSSASVPHSGGVTVLEGIKESVRLLAAGLSITSPPINTTTNLNITSQQSPHLGTPHKASRTPTPRIYTHNKGLSTNLSTTSTSSVSTSAGSNTKSGSPSSSCWTRRSLETSLSGSSASSISVSASGLEEIRSGAGLFSVSCVDGSVGNKEDATKGEKVDEEVDVTELIVRDTGATPTVSPNPKFRRRVSVRMVQEQRRQLELQLQQQQQQMEAVSVDAREDVERKEVGWMGCDGDVGVVVGSTGVEEKAGKRGVMGRCHRRKSRDVERDLAKDLERERRGSEEMLVALDSFGFGGGVAPNGKGADKEKERKEKRASLVGGMQMMLPPVSSIPGLGSLASVGWNQGQSPNLSPGANPNPERKDGGGVGWGGKKWPWEGLSGLGKSGDDMLGLGLSSGKGTGMGRSQKRGSLLLDVSQSLASAFSLAGAGLVGGGGGDQVSGKGGQGERSLLDDDDDDDEMGGIGGSGSCIGLGMGGVSMGVMQPVRKYQGVDQVTSTATPGGNEAIKVGGEKSDKGEDEDEWNW
ncbi:hypothetical protein AMATHDRAFT_9357 [Amanita thiersii Skay4041]|uniref:Uncharacterized protein n=1 Tax=Amanita thiersii Skay4041 TaxID=703135 RepID=A0A2A9NAX1_9AGAR|nr:hypothetical protein AMATHDRAFT_9357 [Amanita thiersii Skay4041]